MISVQKVPATNRLLVCGLTDDITEQFLELHFESKRVGGDSGYVSKVDMNPLENSAIITFTNANGK